MDSLWLAEDTRVGWPCIWIIKRVPRVARVEREVGISTREAMRVVRAILTA